MPRVAVLHAQRPSAVLRGSAPLRETSPMYATWSLLGSMRTGCAAHGGRALSRTARDVIRVADQGGEGGEGRSAASLGAFGGVISLGVIDAMAAVGGIYIGGPRYVLPYASTALVRTVSSWGLLCRLGTWFVGRAGASSQAAAYGLRCNRGRMG